jgi:shikimate kinase
VTAEGHIVLVGLMATGKTTVGTRVAAELHRPFFDSDEMIEEKTGHTVAQLWAEGGEPAFRDLEAKVFVDALDSAPPAVIAAAGGVVLREENRTRLHQAAARGAEVVWLRANPELLAARTQPGDHRPLLDGDPLGVLRRMATDRQALYEDVATRVIDVDGQSVDAVVQEVLR